MADTQFLVKGTVRFGGETRPFSKRVSAAKKDSAIAKIKSIFGSNYKIKAHLVKVESVEAAP